jgi:tRNA isopentenyl-2-thiomethyl-A-37 hydroxylase MiaE
MQTASQWWESVKSDENKINDWLIKQYRGEVTAATRIIQFGLQYAGTEKQVDILATIAKQETQHAEWIYELLEARNIKPVVEDAEKRYWAKTLLGIKDFETGAAVAAHAEGMRLSRIRVIASDEFAPGDIREVFKKILKDEVWHEKAFTQLSSPEALEATKENHEAGVEALGLVL